MITARMMVKVFFAYLVLVVGIALPLNARSALITGDLDTSGVLTLNSTSGLTFLPAVAGGGRFVVGAGTGTFAPLAGTSGTISNIDLVPGAVDVPAFLTLASAPALQFRLASILPGIFSLVQCGSAPLVGQQCSPAIPGVGLSALNFLNANHGSTLSFEIDGEFHNTATAERTPYAGLFTAQFALRYQDILAAFENGQPVTTTYSGTFQQIGAPIPESSQATLLGFGFATLWILLLAARGNDGDSDLVDHAQPGLVFMHSRRPRFWTLR